MHLASKLQPSGVGSSKHGSMDMRGRPERSGYLHKRAVQMHLDHGVCHNSKVQVMSDSAVSARSISQHLCSRALSSADRAAVLEYSFFMLLPFTFGHKTSIVLAVPV